MTTGKLEDIERRLASGELEDLFAETLGWGRLTHPPLLRPVGAPVNQEIKLTPLAQMGDLPVFRVHWPKDKPPTIAERRAVLRALHQAYHEHLLVYVTQNKDQLLFVWPKTVGEGRTARVELRALPYTRGEPARTTVERLALLGFSLDEVGRHGVPTIQVLDRLDRAFDVEAVTKQFFTDYRRLFEEVECQVDGVADTATRRLFVQSLFNRLLFIVFLERKGWLTFQGSRDYLRALWVDHLREKSRGEPSSFYRDRLKLLFFAGLNTPHEVDVVGIARNGFLQSRIGHVPYLNGGLFEESESDRDPDISVPDAALEPVIQELLYHYNFTVTESTPLDIEVAVDPEMLGRIFEELVTGRHESGSYYTPKQVVAFMCREALKDYLAVRCAREDHTAIASFVDDRDGTRLRNAEAVLAALRSVRVCDPACGSGAYLVGMLHELIDLRDALFVSRGLDPLSAYRRKLDVIQENLYGVDLDPFAVNIARLRLWLSLIVDFDDGAPPPLPNLDLKVEPGDSLTAPDPSAGLAAGFRKELVERVFELKAQYLMAHGGAKLRLREEIQSLTADIRAWAGRGPEAEGFDWAVEFAEVFSSGGFDIVITNPPYVRQELIRDAKPVLKRLYPDVYSGTADLYVYFYLRALQLLKPGGVLCFISSNKWMRAAYGERLRRHLSQDTTVQTIIDFGDLPVFTATAYPCIVLARKEKPSPQHTIQALTVTDISAVQRLAEEVGFRAWQQPQASMRPQGWSLARPAVLALMDKLRQSGQPLGKYVGGRFYYGIKTGLNEAFVIDEATRMRLLAEDPRSAEVIKPWLRGRDVKRWAVDWAGLYLIAIKNSGDQDAGHRWRFAESEAKAREMFAATYPAIHEHLSRYEKELRVRRDQGRYWWELRACAYFAAFAGEKIVVPTIVRVASYAADFNGFYSNDKTTIVCTDDLAYVLGLLNSSVLNYFLRSIASTKQGGFFECKPMYLEQLPVPSPDDARRQAVEMLVGRLTDLHGQVPEAQELESELNRLVYEIYRLSEDEIALIEDTLAGG